MSSTALFVTLEAAERGISLYKRNDFELLNKDDEMNFACESGAFKCMQKYYAFDREG